MTKKLGIIIASIVVIAIVGFIVFQWSESAKEPKLSAAEIRGLVESQYPGTISEPALVAGENGAVYEVTSNNGDKSYDIRMDGNTGEVLTIDMIDNAAEAANKDDVAEEKKDSPKENNETTDKNNTEQTESQENKQQDASKAVIGLDEAKEIALQQFTGTFEQVELDENDDRLNYEIEMRNETEEAEILIDAYTGEVILLDIQTDDED